MLEYFVIWESGGTMLATRVFAASAASAIQTVKVSGRVFVIPVTSAQSFTATRRIEVVEGE